MATVDIKRLNALRVAADVTESDKLFHTRAAAIEKACSPTVERRVGGTTWNALSSCIDLTSTPTESDRIRRETLCYSHC